MAVHPRYVRRDDGWAERREPDLSPEAIDALYQAALVEIRRERRVDALEVYAGRGPASMPVRLRHGSRSQW